MDNVAILKIGTDEAVKSVSDLKSNISALKEQLSQLEIGSQEYQSTLKELNTNQAALTNAMNGTTASMADITKAAKGMGDTYNSLVKKMADTKRELRNVDVSTESGRKRFKELADQVKEYNDKLKKMDAAQGNFQRNVGNYTSALDGFSGALKLAGGASSGLTAGIGSLSGAMKMLAANPVIAVMGALVSIFLKVKDAIAKNAELTNRLTVAMSRFKEVTDIAAKVLDTLASGLVWTIEQFNKLATAIGVVNDAQQAHIDLAKEQLALMKSEREATMALANIDLMIAKKRAEASDKEKHTAEERYKLYEDIERLEARKLEIQKDNLAKRYELLRREHNFTATSNEGLDAEAKAYADMVNAETTYYEKLAGTKKRMSAIAKELEAETKNTTAATSTAIKQTIVEAADATKEMDDAVQAEVAALFARLDSELTQADRVAAHLLEMSLDGVAKTASDAVDAAQRKLDVLQEFLDAAYDRGDLGSQLSLEKQVADQQVALEEAKNAQMKKLYDEDAKNKEKAEAAKKTAISAGVDAASSMLKSMADIMESQGELTEEEANRVKGVRIAAAVIDTISGAVGAYMQAAATLPPPLGAIVGAVQAAAITAAGAAQIATMKSTSVTDGNASVSSPSVVSAPKVVTQIPQTAIVTKTSTEDAINSISQPQKVYILQSDLEAAGKASKVKVNESTF